MKKKLYIITGASRGIGRALSELLTKKDNHLVCIARSSMDELFKGKEQVECTIQLLQKDLVDPEIAMKLIPEIFADIHPEDYQELTLINNAAMLEPIANCGDGNDSKTRAHIQLNLLTPMLLTSALIRETQHWTCSKTVLNISSGAGSNPYHGWSAYCTSKAGIDMFTRCVGMEQMTKEHGVRILAIAPGVVDTHMQEIIRSSDASSFPEKDRFVRLKENGALRLPMDVATDLLRVLDQTNLPNGSVVDIRELDA